MSRDLVRRLKVVLKEVELLLLVVISERRLALAESLALAGSGACDWRDRRSYRGSSYSWSA